MEYWQWVKLLKSYRLSQLQSSAFGCKTCFCLEKYMAMNYMKGSTCWKQPQLARYWIFSEYFLMSYQAFANLHSNLLCSCLVAINTWTTVKVWLSNRGCLGELQEHWQEHQLFLMETPLGHFRKQHDLKPWGQTMVIGPSYITHSRRVLEEVKRNVCQWKSLLCQWH